MDILVLYREREPKTDQAGAWELWKMLILKFESEDAFDLHFYFNHGNEDNF